MAGTAKKKSSTKSNTKAKKRKSSAREAKRRSELRIEIISLVLIAVTLILLLSNFGMCGKVGNALSAFMFGAFGFMAYIFPVLLFAFIMCIMANISDKNAVVKILFAAILYIFVCVLFYLVVNGGDTSFKALDVYMNSRTNRSGGGVIGGGIGHLFIIAFGNIGAYIVTVLCMLISVVVITEKSIIKAVRQHGAEAIDNAREDCDNIRENNENAKEDRARRRQQRAADRTKRVKGVAKVVIGDKSGGEIHEITDVIEPVKGDDIIYRGHIDIDGSANNISQYIEDNKDSDKEPFTPKEKIEVPQEAKDTMKRPAYGTKAVSQKSGEGGEGVSDEIKKRTKRISKRKYRLPKSSDILVQGESARGTTKAELHETGQRLVQTLAIYGVDVTLKEVSKGPSVTRYELQPAIGTKVSKITSLSDEIKMNMAVSDIRIEAPIPGKSAVGIEIPNSGKEMVHIRELIDSSELKGIESRLAFAAGKDISGKVVTADIAKMPHMLVAGTTGSGKSVFTNSIIINILYRATPDEVKLIIIDPKVVEFGIYNGIPHLLIPVVTDPKKAAGALNWAVAEMTERYKKFADLNVKDLQSYNKKAESMDVRDGEERPEKLPQILIIIDELADLMMVASKEVESAICRLAQLARAAGIHLVIATQRPSVDVVTGLIKANIPSRVALLVSSGTDSRTIIGCNGAEKLLGNGDMLFYPSGYVKPVRVQGAYVSDTEIQRTVSFWSEQNGDMQYDEEIIKKVNMPGSSEGKNAQSEERDEYFEEAGRIIIEKNKATTSMLQRMFRVGFNRAARIMDQLNEAGVVSDEEGTKPRSILMTMEEFDAYLENNQ